MMSESRTFLWIKELFHSLQCNVLHSSQRWMSHILKFRFIAGAKWSGWTSVHDRMVHVYLRSNASMAMCSQSMGHVLLWRYSSSKIDHSESYCHRCESSLQGGDCAHQKCSWNHSFGMLVFHVLHTQKLLNSYVVGNMEWSQCIILIIPYSTTIRFSYCHVYSLSSSISLPSLIIRDVFSVRSIRTCKESSKDWELSPPHSLMKRSL